MRILRIIAGSVAVLVACGGANGVAAPALTAPPSPRLGTVRLGATVHTAVTLRNAGKEAVEIERVWSPCDCATALLAGGQPTANASVPAGGSVTLDVTLDTSKMAASDLPLASGGEWTKPIYVYAKGEVVHAAAVVELRGRLANGVSFEPAVLDLGRAPGRKGAVRTVKAVYDAALFVPGKARLAAPAPLRVEQVGQPAPAGNGLLAVIYRVSVPPGTPAMPLSGVARAEGLAVERLKGQPLTDKLAFVGEVTAAVSVQPPQAVFGLVPAPDPKATAADKAVFARRRTRWVLLLRPELAKPAKPASAAIKPKAAAKPAAKPATKPAAAKADPFWLKTTARADSPDVSVAVLAAPGKPAAGQPEPPSDIDRQLPPGAACWLRVSLLPTAKPGKPLAAHVTVTFPTGEKALIPVSAEVE